MRRGTLRAVVLGLALILVVGVVLMVRDSTDAGRHRLTATFDSTVNLHEGADVKVLGVSVGTVTDVRVEGTAVEVSMTYDDNVRVPADAQAVIVPPSIVGDRFVQLTPAYPGEGPTLADGATLDRDRTAVPVELDDTYRQLTVLTKALGPQGANRDGSLSRLVRATARTLDGNGARFRGTVGDLAAGLDTLADADSSYQATVSNARSFTRTLKANDAAIRRLVLRLARVSGQLNAQRDDISRAAVTMTAALDDVARFVRSHRGRLTRTVAGLRDVSGGLTTRIRDLQDLLALAPVGFVSAMNINLPTNYDFDAPARSRPAGRTTSYLQRGIFTTNTGTQVSSLVSSVCEQATGPAAAQLGDFCDALAAAGYDLGLLVTELQSMDRQAAAGAGAGSVPLDQVLQRLRQEAAR